MKARETIGKPVSMFGEPIPVGNYHFSTEGSRHRPEGEEPKYVGILRTLDKKRSRGKYQFWWYWIATFAPKNVKGTAMNTCVPYKDEEAAIRAWRDVRDRYYPEDKDNEFGCKDWFAMGENKKRVVTLNESQLRKLVAESVKKVLAEINGTGRSYHTAKAAFDKMMDLGQTVRANQLRNTFNDLSDDPNSDVVAYYPFSDTDAVKFHNRNKYADSLRSSGPLKASSYTYANNYEPFDTYCGEDDDTRQGERYDDPKKINDMMKHIKNVNPNTSLTKNNLRR